MGRHTSLEMKIWLERSKQILSRQTQEDIETQEHQKQQEVQEMLDSFNQIKESKIPYNLQHLEMGCLQTQPLAQQQSIQHSLSLFDLPQQNDTSDKLHIKPISIKQIKLRQQRDQMRLQPKNCFDREESDFESDSENALNSQNENLNRSMNFLLFDSFLLQKEQNLQQLKNLTDLRKFELLTFLNRQLREQNKKKEFQCQYCSKSFDKASALGGHTSKNHPSKSKSYQKRIFSSCIRKIERKRSSFLKNKLNSQK